MNHDILEESFANGVARLVMLPRIHEKIPIVLAREQRFLHIEALAAQLCAEFHLDAGRTRIGALYLIEARDAYSRWGALAVVAHLEAKYPRLLTTSVGAANRNEASSATLSTTSTSTTSGGLQLDVGTTVRASQVLSSELNPEQVVSCCCAGWLTTM